MKSCRITLIVLNTVLAVLGASDSGLAQVGVPGSLVVSGVAPVSGAVVPATNPALLGQIEARLLANEQRLARWREVASSTTSADLLARRPGEWASCYEALEGLVASYKRLHGLAAHPADPDFDPWSVLGRDITFLEGECPQVYRLVASLGSGSVVPAVLPEPPASVSVELSVAGEQLSTLGEPEKLDVWNKAMGLFDAGKYDEAIVELAVLAHTSYAGVAKEKIREAQAVVAKKMRTQAAEVFVKARKTDSPAQKKKLLEESWTLLNRIVTNYPEAGILDKVKQNLILIEEQLEKLDPAMLDRLKHPGGEKG